MGEAAVDEGWPKHELFCLLHKETISSKLFVGEEKQGKRFAHNLIAALGNEYYIYGVCCALAVINGAMGPQFFCPQVVDYILHGDIKMVQNTIDNLPNKSLKCKLQQLSNTSNESVFEKEMSLIVSELHDSVGYISSNLSFQNKEEVLNSVALHYIITQNLCEINQFIDGLKSFGVLDVLRRNQNEARAILQVSHVKLTAEVVDDLFLFELSPDGSNRNQNEKAILFNWSQLLEDVENGLASSEVDDPYLNKEVHIEITLEAILAFITGSTGIPPLGFSPQPTIIFDHVNTSKKLHVSTCSNTLYFPINESL